MELINSIIGKKVYPNDNSYIKCLSNQDIKCPSLAGEWKWDDLGWSKEFEELPKLVTIISEPYEVTYLPKYGSAHKVKFISVLYEGEVYMMLNTYTEEIKEQYIPPAIDDLTN